MNQPASNDNTIAALTHAGGIFFTFFPSLIVWLVYKDKSAFVEDQAKEALNFQISMMIGYFISFILIFVLIGIVIIWVLVILDIIFCIIGAVKSSSGERFRYPFAIRLIK